MYINVGLLWIVQDGSKPKKITPQKKVISWGFSLVVTVVHMENNAIINNLYWSYFRYHMQPLPPSAHYKCVVCSIMFFIKIFSENINYTDYNHIFNPWDTLALLMSSLFKISLSYKILIIGFQMTNPCDHECLLHTNFLEQKLSPLDFSQWKCLIISWSVFC